jgi:hypothetical protein
MKLILGPWDCQETKESLEYFESLLNFHGAEVRLEDGEPFELYCGGKICVFSKNPENLEKIKRILRDYGFGPKNCTIYVKRRLK